MPARCPDCDRALVPVEIPPALREFAPDDAAVVGSCPRCLRTVPIADSNADTADSEAHSASGSRTESGDAEIDFPDAIPDGDGGVAIALLLGLLDSLATNRAAIEALVDRAERSGADVFLTIDRLDADGSIEPHVDLGRRRRQLESLLDG